MTPEDVKNAAMEEYQKRLSGANNTLRQHNELLKDGHSIARGMAGAVGQIWLTWGNILPLVAGAAVGSSVKNAVTEFANLEYQLTFVKSLSTETNVSMQELYEGVHRVSAAMGVSPGEAAKGLRALSQAGLDAKQALDALSPVFKLASVGELSVAEAATSAVGIMNSFSMDTTREINRVSDVLAKAGAASATSVASITESMRYGAVAADQYGVSLEKAATILTVLGKRNITGSSAGTAMKNMLSEIYSPTSTEGRYILKDVLGVKAFNADGTRKELFSVIEEMRRALGGFTVESQGMLLRSMFGERGDKAFGALLATTTDSIKKIEKQMTDSAGFTTEVFVQQQQTVKGQWDLTVTAIKNALSGIGSASASPAIQMLGEVRSAFESDVVRSALTGLTQSFMSLSRVVLYVGPALAGVWASLRIGGLAIAGAAAAVPALNTVLGAVGLSGVMSRVAAAGTTLGTAITGLFGPFGMLVKLVAGAAIGYALLHERKNSLIETAAEEAKGIDRVTEAMKKENEELSKKIALRKAGVRADSLSEMMQMQAYRDTVSQMEIRHDTVTMSEAYRRGDSRALDEAKSLEAGLAVERRALSAREQVFKDHQAKMQEMRDLDRKEATADAAAMAKALGTGTRTYNPNHRKDASEAHALLNSENKGALDQLQNEERILKARMEFEKKRDEITYGAGKFGGAIQAVLAERREYDALNSTLELNLKTRAAISQMLGNSTLKPVDRQNLMNRQAQLKFEEDQLKQQMQYEVELAKLRGQSRVRSDYDAFNKSYNAIGTSLDKRKEEINRQYFPKSMSPLDAAEEDARSKVREDNLSRIQKYQDDLNVKTESYNLLLQAVKDTTAEIERLNVKEPGYVTKRQELEATLTKQRELATAVRDSAKMDSYYLENMKKGAREAEDKVGAYARAVKEQSMSAKSGWDKFWEDMKYNAEDSATTVKNALSGAFGKASDALATFVTTGKINFKSLVASMLAEAAKAMANKAMAQLFGMVANYAVSAFGGTTMTSSTRTDAGTSGTNSYSDGSGYYFNSTSSAWGNVMTSSGPMALQRYSSGGIARRPQLSMFGEGSTPEAYVPLPDGRSIPVTVDGKGSSGDATAVNITVNVSSDGNSKVESDNSGNKAAQLGKMIEGVVTQVIVKEKRPGGLLYAS